MGFLKRLLSRDTAGEKAAKTFKEHVAQAKRTICKSELLELTLKAIGCEVNKEQGEKEGVYWLYTTYQGEHFRIYVSDNCRFITIQDLAWYGAPVSDIANMSLMRRAINECNTFGSCVIVYTIDDEDQQFVLHSIKESYWSQEIDDTDKYIMSLFDRLLESHHHFFAFMEKYRQEEFSKHND